MESPAPDPHDPHSSEEELEVINSNPKCERLPRPLRAASVCLPEKRKWSQIGDHHKYVSFFSLGESVIMLMLT